MDKITLFLMLVLLCFSISDANTNVVMDEKQYIKYDQDLQERAKDWQLYERMLDTRDRELMHNKKALKQRQHIFYLNIIFALLWVVTIVLGSIWLLKK